VCVKCHTTRSLSKLNNSNMLLTLLLWMNKLVGRCYCNLPLFVFLFVDLFVSWCSFVCISVQIVCEFVVQFSTNFCRYSVCLLVCFNVCITFQCLFTFWVFWNPVTGEFNLTLCGNSSHPVSCLPTLMLKIVK
jgi:hypothetical protein